jgi:hypothetical protein
LPSARLFECWQCAAGADIVNFIRFDSKVPLGMLRKYQSRLIQIVED